MHAELQPIIELPPILRGSGDLLFASYASKLDELPEIHCESMEAKGYTDSWFSLRAREMAGGKPEPMPNITELLADPA